MKTQKTTQGFTLIEVLMTVAILGIIAALAFPSYQVYIVKTKLMEGYSFLERAKLDVELYYSRTHNLTGLTSSNFSTKLDLPKSIDTDLVDEYWISPWSGHDVTIWFKTKADAPIPSDIQNKWPFYLTGNINDSGDLVWDCKTGYAGFPAKYAPSKCQ